MYVQSILDTDLYKFTTSYAYFKLFPQAEGTFVFHDRDDTVYDQNFVDDLRRAFDELGRLALTDEEFDYMVANCRFIPQNYFEWLRGFRFDPKRISTWIDEHGHLHIEASDFMYKVTLYEIAVLTTVSTLRNSTHAADMSGVMTRLKEKIALSNAEHLLFSDFGTRRRFSFEVHRAVMEYIRREARYCAGTSNCYLAMKLGMKMIGTYPHELPMFIAAVNGGPRQANYLAMEHWVNVYDGYLGIALPGQHTQMGGGEHRPGGRDDRACGHILAPEHHVLQRLYGGIKLHGLFAAVGQFLHQDAVRTLRQGGTGHDAGSAPCGQRCSRGIARVKLHHHR